MNVASLDLLEALAIPQQGVFTTSDLLAIKGGSNRSSLARWIGPLMASGRIQRARRDLYLWRNARPESVARHLALDATLSFGSALARHLLIGSIPTRHIRFTAGCRETHVETAQWNMTIHHLDPAMAFGVIEDDDGTRIADPEKAVLDCLYFQQRGVHFSFDLESDIERSALRRDVFLEYVERYNNPRFRSRCRRWLDAF